MHQYSWELSVAEIAKHGELLLARMRKRWPAAFDTAKPLKLGIRNDMIAARFSAQDADVFMSWYSQTPEYLSAQAEPGAQRHDLHGVPVGEVLPENATYAAQRLMELRHQKFQRALIGDGKG